MRLSAIIVGAGSSTRAGFDKVLARIGGRAVIQYSLESFERAGCVGEIVVVCRDAATAAIHELVQSAKLRKVRAVVCGGERRQDSVRAGLNAVSPSTDFVAVHDAARPLITPGEIEGVFAAAQKHGGAILAAPVTDTLKRADATLFVSSSIDRTNVFAMQTPQIFTRQLLLDAYERITECALPITDEVSAVENIGARIAIVPAQYENMKITFPRDLALAEFVLQQRSMS